MTRTDEILKLIVEHFIKTAEPVGSKTLQEVYRLNVSSATIRNEMNALEKDGYLEKTHTSSGRVPSEKGYQYYVEHLRTGGVDEQAQYALQTILSERSKSVEEILKESCEILSDMTNLATVVLGNGVHDERLVSIQVIPISESAATAVFVTDHGYVDNRTFVVDKSMAMNDVVKTVKVLNDRLSGTPIADICPKLEAMKPALSDYLIGQDLIYNLIVAAFAKFATARMSYYGKDALYRQPEFANDAEKLRNLLSFLDDPRKLEEALRESEKAENGIHIHYGDEDSSEDLSIVSADISLPGNPGASLTLVGPKRMDYDRVVATLKYFADTLDKYFAEVSGTNPKGGKEWKKKQSSQSSSKSKTSQKKKK